MHAVHVLWKKLNYGPAKFRPTDQPAGQVIAMEGGEDFSAFRMRSDEGDVSLLTGEISPGDDFLTLACSDVSVGPFPLTKLVRARY